MLQKTPHYAIPACQLAEKPLPLVEASERNFTMSRLLEEFRTGGNMFSHQRPSGTNVPLLNTSLTCTKSKYQTGNIFQIH